MPISIERVSTVIADIYAAPSHGEGFEPVTRSIRKLLNGSSSMLFTPQNGPAEGGFGFVDHFDTQLSQRYRDELRLQSPWELAAERKRLLSPRSTFTDEDLVSERELRRQAFFHEAHVPLDVGRVCCTVIAGDSDPSLPLTYLSVYRGIGARPFGSEESRAIRLLGPHLLRSLRLASRLRFAEINAAAAQNVLDALSCGVVLLDAGQRIVFMSSMASSLCRDGTVLLAKRRPSGGCVLTARLAGEQVRLQRVVEAALLSAAGVVSERCVTDAGPTVVRGPDGRAIAVTASPLPLALGGAIEGAPRVLVLLDDPFSKREATREALLLQLFGLTPAECRVALALLAGMKPKAIAQSHAVSENTVRTQIRCLYEKTGTRGIGQLTLMLSRVLTTALAGKPTHRT